MALMTTAQLPREGGLLSALAALFTTLAEKRARFVEYRRVLAELNSMSDRELADLGISQHPVNANTSLTGIAEFGRHNTGHRGIQIRVGKHQHRGIATQFQRQSF